jgi:hypothetical protein
MLRGGLEVSVTKNSSRETGCCLLCRLTTERVYTIVEVRKINAAAAAQKGAEI